MNDGSFISVLKDWNSSTKGQKLKELHSFFCENFDVVLGPNANANHKDHFHIDLNPKLRSTYESAAPSWDSLGLTALSLTGEEEIDQSEGHELPHAPIDYEALEAESVFQLTSGRASTCR
ncbi:extensin family protein [Dolichospermum sp. ST_sed1]|nr:extensin family protein [Dolichospermum sp. ST_sed1]